MNTKLRSSLALSLLLSLSCLLGAQEGPPIDVGPPPRMDMVPVGAQPGAGLAVDAGGSGERNPYGSSRQAVIQVDPDTGNIIIYGDEAVQAQARLVLESLDKPVPQVLIKVLFLEVTHTNKVDLGVEWQAGYDGNNPADRDIIETAFGVASETRGGFYRILERDFSATLRALSEVGKLEVLSRPSILTRNNQEAVITVGQEVPFIRNSRVTQDGQIINTVEYEDIGIILRVTPHITPEGLVEMDLSPEISTLTGDTVPISAGVEAPVFAKRSAETRVVVPNARTVVIGGLMEDNKTETTRKVPLLGDIPFLGAAFRRKIETTAKTELLIFLTPYVVNAASELLELSASEQRKSELAPQVFTQRMMEKYLDATEEPATLQQPDMHEETRSVQEHAMAEEPGSEE